MFGINQVTIVGTLAVDPDVQEFNGKKRANLLIAINEKEQRIDKETGELAWKDITRWAVAEFWGPQANFIQKYVSKGSNVGITGKFARSNWEDKEGVKKNKTIVEGDKIILLTSQKPSKKETAKAVLSYLEDLQIKGKNMTQGIEELKQITGAVETLADMPF